MLKVGGGIDLGKEAFCPEGGGEIGPEDLERHQPVVAEILGEINRRHPAFTEQALNDIAAREGGVQTGDQIHEVISLRRPSSERHPARLFYPPVSVDETSQWTITSSSSGPRSWARPHPAVADRLAVSQHMSGRFINCASAGQRGLSLNSAANGSRK